MQARSVIADKNRHYKTLILLVICMTVGAFFLFWLGQVTPVTPLRGKAKSAASWKQIMVRTASLADSGDKGFFHLRIDENGRLYQTNAWKAGAADPRRQGTIQVLLTVARPNESINAAQEKTLVHLISDLRREHNISVDKVLLDKSESVVSSDAPDSLRSVGL